MYKVVAGDHAFNHDCCNDCLVNVLFLDVELKLWTNVYKTSKKPNVKGSLDVDLNIESLDTNVSC
jgi:hypothetical protein